MENNNQNKSATETLTWKAPAFQVHKRAPGWYMWFTIVSIGLIAFAIYNKSILTTITFGLMIAVIFLISREHPREITYKITKTGIHIGQNFYPYKTIRIFWIIYRPPHVKTVYFETTAMINNKISMQLGNQDPIKVKEVLAKYIPEDLQREESMSEALARRLKI